MNPHRIKIQIGKKDQAVFKHILESYENLVTVSTLDAKDCILEVYVPAGNLDTAEGLLKSLQKELGFHILDKSEISE